MNMNVVIFALVAVLAGCVSIPKPDWNPGNTAPAPQTGERATCPLPAQWVWNAKYSQWVCVATPAYCGAMYYSPHVYYGPVHPWPGYYYYGGCCRY